MADDQNGEWVREHRRKKALEERRVMLFAVLSCVWLFACASYFGLGGWKFFVAGWLGWPASWYFVTTICRE